jgi:predicted RNase H-like HicB family nuclease
MSTEGDASDARRDTIRAWLAPGVDIDMYEPTPESSSYRAVIPEFGLTGEGKTYEEAFAAVIEHFATFLAGLIDEDLPLPDRNVWFAKHPRPTADSYD